jgi:hypothetical protein
MSNPVQEATMIDPASMGGADDDDFSDSVLEQPASGLNDVAPGLNDVDAAAAAATEATNSTLTSVVQGLTHQIPSSPGAGKSIQWAPNLVTYVGTSPAMDDFVDPTDILPEGSVHLSEASFDLNSSPGDDFNTSMRDFR